MKKQGFTLVELLAVIVILGLIGLITIPAVAKTIRDAKKEKNEINADTILNAAYDYTQKHIKKLPSATNGATGEKICAMELVCNGLLKESITSEVENFGGHAIVVTYYSTVSNAPSEIDKNSKFFGKYLFTYKEDTSCASYACTPTSN